MGDGCIVNIEVQKADDDDHQRRVRYNGALLTINVTDPGDKFKNVPDVIVVFISRFDVFKYGKALYHVDRISERLVSWLIMVLLSFMSMLR